MSHRASALLLIGLATTLAACGKKDEPVITPTPVDTVGSRTTNLDSLRAAQRADSIARAQQAERDRLAAAEAARAGLMSELTAMIHFDYDQFTIRGDDQAKLTRKAAIMAANSGLRIRIVGHADERGSDEYNLALSMRRAVAAKDYMVRQGVDAGRIDVASLGEERPADPASNESAWSMNRRDEFEVIAGGQNLMPPGNR
jgi:peptidoglycan-associated lipoprotein